MNELIFHDNGNIIELIVSLGETRVIFQIFRNSGMYSIDAFATLGGECSVYVSMELHACFHQHEAKRKIRLFVDHLFRLRETTFSLIVSSLFDIANGNVSLLTMNFTRNQEEDDE